MLLTACTRGEDRAMVDGSVNCGGADTAKQLWTAGLVGVMVDGRSLLVLGLLGSKV